MLRDLVDGLRSLVPGETLVERRARIRVHCHYPVRVESQRGSFRCLVTDIGPRGLRLKFVGPLKQGEAVRVIYPQTDDPRATEVACRTVWCRKRRFSSDLVAGLEYAEPPAETSWAGQVLTELGLGPCSQRRRWLRAAAEIPALLDDLGALVLDLGMGGARLQINRGAGDSETARLRLGPWDELPAVDLQARLVSRQRESDIDAWTLGVGFGDPSPQEVRLLGCYVVRLLRESFGP